VVPQTQFDKPFLMLYVDTEFHIPIEIPKVMGKYRFHQVLGKGATSVVFEVERISTNEIFACKVIPREMLNYKDALFHLEHELRIHMSLDHPNILKVEEVVYQDRFIFVFLEYCSNGDLFQWISKTSYSLNHKMVQQMISALSYLHSRGIAHQDIKPENILLDSDWNIKLADFGNCGGPVRSSSQLTFFGTYHYAPPEIYRCKDFDIKAVDIWQLGILIFELYTGELPWSSDEKKMKKQILQAAFIIPEEIPRHIQKIIRMCTVVNPQQRATIGQIELGLSPSSSTFNKRLVASGKNVCWSSLVLINKGKSLNTLPTLSIVQPSKSNGKIDNSRL